MYCHTRNICVAALACLLAAWLPASAQSPEAPPLELTASLDGGYYQSGVLVELVATRPAEIFYTLDGSRPGKKSLRYREPIRIDRTLTLRAVAVEGPVSSGFIGHTYLINEPATTLPTVSISLPGWVLFDPERGLFQEGPNVVDSLAHKPGANFWSRQEMFVHAEIFDETGLPVHSSPMGLRLFGGMSRLFPQKSLALVARKRYGPKKVRYPVFGPEGLRKFKYLILRNSGSDWGKAHLRDAYMTSLLQDWDMEVQDYQPAQVYINGRYWGIYNLREKINKYFIEDHAEADRDSIDFLEHYMTVRNGNRRHYQRMREYIRTRDIRQPEHFAWVESQMEVDNFIDFQVAQIFFDNRDAGGNIRFWRPRTNGGRWRWILYDTDYGFGLHSRTAYAFNSLAFHTDPDGPAWPNPPWSTFLLRRLLENPGFRHRFINRFADHLNTTFRPERSLGQLNRMVERLRPEIGRHQQRWGLSSRYWESHIERMREFALKRPEFVYEHLKTFFQAGEEREVVIVCSKGGFVRVNDHLQLGVGRFRGTYFSEVPITLAAMPQFGNRFSHWEHLGEGNSPDRLLVELQGEVPVFKAVFEPYHHPLEGKVVINEVAPNNPDRRGGDWVELYNSTEATVNLHNWVLTDGRHQYFFPDVELPPKDYLVLCEDSLALRQEYPKAFRVIGGLSFGINKRKEFLGLYSPELAGIDSLSYQLFPSDSVFAMSLLLPYLDNSDLENWSITIGQGTPGAPNPYYVESRVRGRQLAWLRVGVAIVVLLVCFVLLRLRDAGRI